MAGRAGVIQFLEAGLAGTGLRGKVIANNIANLGTKGFRRSDVRFENLLAKALDGGADPASVKPEIHQPRDTPVNSLGNDVDLDTEIGQMIRNGSQGSVYLRTLAKMYKQMELAMRDNI
jgi:flagellar basal-body rod protein FlgB